MEEEQNSNLTQTPIEQPLQPEAKRSKYKLFILVGLVALVTLGVLSLAYGYMQKGSAMPIDYKTNVTLEESDSSEVVVEDENDLDPLLTEVDSTNSQDLEKDYQQAISESSGL